MGNGDGTFQASRLYGSEGDQPVDVVVADVNGDGRPDLLMANCTTCVRSSIGVFLGNGDGTFQPVVNYDSGGTAANALAVADLNGDGKPDIAVTNLCLPGGIRGPCTGGYTNYVTVLLGNGDGTFQSAVNYTSGGSRPNSVAIGDINGDGKPDLLVSNTYPSGSVAVLLGNGDGTFQEVVNYDAGGVDAGSIAVADVDGDGKLDVVVVNHAQIDSDLGNGVGLLTGNGDGTLQPAVTYGARPYTSSAVAVADVSADGRPDLVVASWSSDNAGSIAVLINDGNH